MMFEQYPDILTVEEACEALRMGYNAVYELLNEGKLKAYKNGRVWRIPKESLVRYVLEKSKL
jgi:excisionase family DNA binding protein